MPRDKRDTSRSKDDNLLSSTDNTDLMPFSLSDNTDLIPFSLSTKKDGESLGLSRNSSYPFARSSVIGDTLNKVSRLGIENE